jgi:hypothetical protein
VLSEVFQFLEIFPNVAGLDVFEKIGDFVLER